MTARDDDELSSHVHRVAVLIAAGIAPVSAWRHVAEAARPADSALDAVVARLDAGDPVAGALGAVAAARGSAWRALAASWVVAAASGAPLAPALDAFAVALRDRAAAQRDIAVALASPRATARVVLVLPFVAVLLALLMGVDLVEAAAHPLGAASIVIGLALAGLARVWMRRLLRAAQPPPPTAGLDLELLAVAAAGGGSPESALRLVAEAMRAAGLDGRPASGGVEPRRSTADARTAGEPPDALDALDALVVLSRRSGAPLGALARAEAADERSRARSAAREAAERLGVRLMVPLGVCVLPSFMLLGVVPMIVGIVSSTAGVAS